MNTENLIGKTITYHDGFSGCTDTFHVDRVEFDKERDGYKIHDKNPDNGFMFLHSEDVKTLMEQGEYIRHGRIDGCGFRDTFTIQG